MITAATLGRSRSTVSIRDLKDLTEKEGETLIVGSFQAYSTTMTPRVPPASFLSASIQNTHAIEHHGLKILISLTSTPFPLNLEKPHFSSQGTLFFSLLALAVQRTTTCSFVRCDQCITPLVYQPHEARALVGREGSGNTMVSAVCRGTHRALRFSAI